MKLRWNEVKDFLKERENAEFDKEFKSYQAVIHHLVNLLKAGPLSKQEELAIRSKLENAFQGTNQLLSQSGSGDNQALLSSNYAKITKVLDENPKTLSDLSLHKELMALSEKVERLKAQLLKEFFLKKPDSPSQLKMVIIGSNVEIAINEYRELFDSITNFDVPKEWRILYGSEKRAVSQALVFPQLLITLAKLWAHVGERDSLPDCFKEGLNTLLKAINQEEEKSEMFTRLVSKLVTKHIANQQDNQLLIDKTELELDIAHNFVADALDKLTDIIDQNLNLCSIESKLGINSPVNDKPTTFGAPLQRQPTFFDGALKQDELIPQTNTNNADHNCIGKDKEEMKSF